MSSSNNKELEEKLRSAARDGNLEEIIALLNQGIKLDVTNRYGLTPLMGASSEGRVESLQLLLDRGAQVNLQDEYGCTSLMWASLRGHVECMQLLLENCADVSLQDKEGWTPLMAASSEGHSQSVRLLLNWGAQVNHQDKDGRTPLMTASSDGDVVCMQLLLSKGAQVDLQDKHGQTPLMKASSEGHVNNVQLLLDKGAQVDLQDKDGCTALMEASSKGHVQCARLLLDRGAQADIQDKEGKLLMNASLKGNVKLMKLLLDLGVEVNHQDKLGWTPLLEALSEGHDKSVQLLLDRGARVDLQDKERKTPLMVASSKGDVSSVQLLLDRGAQVDYQDNYGRTPLIQASLMGHVKCIELLLDRGAQINHQDNRGQTPLMWALLEGHVACMQLLLYRGAQIDHQHKEGKTPLMEASSNGDVKCVQLLLDRGAQIDHQNKSGLTSLIWASLKGQFQCLKLLLDRGAQVDHQDNDGMTALMWAVWDRHVVCMQLLLDRGAHVDHQDKNGRTPLMKASAEGHVASMQLLLDRGAQVNHQDKHGQTSLMWASLRGHVECMQQLFDRGAQVNHQDKDGQTPLMEALSEGHVECVKLLLDKGAPVDHQDRYGQAPLMLASLQGNVECLQLLLDRGAQLNHQNQDGNTGLHVAASNDKATCVRVLLSHPGIDVKIKNNRGRTAMMIAGLYSLGIFEQILKTCNDFPADSYGKVVLCGHAGAGKSTLTQAIINISKPMTRTTRLVKRALGQQYVAEPLTAGIIPHQVDSPYSNMIIYDLAGHHQYFSSHSACLEAISLVSPAIFLLLQDLRKDPEEMTKEVYYWAAMIDGACHKCPEKSSVIVVGTHADLLTRGQQTRKLAHLKSSAEAAISHHNLVQTLTLNVAKAFSREMDQFMEQLCKINEDILSMSPPISMLCHMMLAFLREKLPDPDVEAISLSDLIVHLEADQVKLIDPHSNKIVPILKSLSEKGLILFIPSEDSRNSWIVLHTESILKKINGALFGDPGLNKEYICVASTTGIVPRAVIKKAFPEYNAEMITQFMIHFELCQAVNLFQVDTNMALEGSSSPDLGPLLFFPALINVGRPSSATVPNNSFRWSLIVKCTHQFFTTRLLHVLLCRLPSEFALPAVQVTPLHPGHHNRRCDVWSKGLKWLSETGVTNIVEMSETFQSLELAMSSPDRIDAKYMELARSVLAVIKNACQEFCPYLDVVEILSCPPEASSDHSDDTKIELSLLKKALLNGSKHIVDLSGQKHAVMEEWMKVEPCLPSLVEVPLPAVTSLLLSEEVGQTTLYLKVPSSQPLSELITIDEVENLEGTPTLPELLSFSDKKVNFARKIGINYIKFGVFLLEDSDGAIVKALEKEHHWNAEDINMAILQQWLQGKGVKPVTWSTLVTALQNI